jgi:hypothetical protein
MVSDEPRDGTATEGNQQEQKAILLMCHFLLTVARWWLYLQIHHCSRVEKEGEQKIHSI